MYAIGDRVVYVESVCPANDPLVGKQAQVLEARGEIIRIRWENGEEVTLISTGFKRLNSVTEIKEEQDLKSVTEIKRGGTRKGAGRRKAEDPSVVVRVPSSQVTGCKEYAKFGFTSDQVLWAYSQYQLKDCGLNIPGVPVPLSKLYQFGFPWLGNFNHFKDSLIEMAQTREDMKIVYLIELSVKFEW